MTTDQENADAAPGWDAIDASLAGLYGNQQPQHVGTIIKHRLGGPDPLDGISVYRRTLPVPHWHYVSYGFSELYGKELDDAAISGYGFELTFRLLARDDEANAPAWVFSFLQNLARYVFRTGNVFSPGDWMTANGPIALDTDTEICSMAFVHDPELAAVETANGSLAFIQVVGLTLDEERAAKQWKTARLLDVLLPSMPLWVTDLHRTSLLGNEAIAAQVKAGTEQDGSSSGYLYTDVLAVQEHKRWLRAPRLDITIGARQVDELRTLLPLRIPFGRAFLVDGPVWQLKFQAGSPCGAQIEDGVVAVTMDADGAREFASALLPREGSYQLTQLPAITWRVQPTLIRDADDNVIERIG